MVLFLLLGTTAILGGGETERESERFSLIIIIIYGAF